MTAIFPIHASDVKSFKSCRRRWDWSSGLRQNLEPDITPIFFLVGRGIHQAMNLYYEKGIPPLATYEEFLIRSNIGDEDLFPGEKDKRKDAIRVGREIARNYPKWINSPDQPDEKWRVVATEMPFSLPLNSPKTGRPSRRIYLEGRFDQIIEDVETGLLWLREFKTAARDPNPSWLDFDDQLTTYCYAAQQIIGRPIAGIQYRFLMKKTPEKPPRLKSGDKLSRAINSTLKTTYTLYEEAIDELALDMLSWRHTNLNAPETPITDLAQGGVLSLSEPLLLEFKEIRQALRVEYYDIREELLQRGWSEYFKEIEVRKTQTEIMNAAAQLWEVGLEMTKPSVYVYPSPDWMKCNFCGFSTPCKVMNAGGNYESIIANMYRKRVPEPEVDTSYIIGSLEE